MSKPSLIRVIVADDQPLIRSGLGAFLMAFDELSLVGEAQNGQEAIQLCELVEPDIAILDVHMPGVDGLATARIIHEYWPQIKILLLCDSEKKDEQLDQAIQEFASGILTKDVGADELAHTIVQMFPSEKSDRQKKPAKKRSPNNHEIPIAEQSESRRPSLAKELAAAGKIQADILPAQAPRIRGWDMAAVLHPARETSGDFFDFIPLANNNWGIVIADVTDKGMGAALFMTLCSTLIRTYATQYPTLPALVMSTVNDRILADTRGDMFVTAFFGVLEPDTGRLRYVNAGHNPPFMISYKKGKSVDSLRPTGMALGVIEDTHWGQKIVRFNPGDLLVLYTDGVTDSQDSQGRFFGEQRLLQMVRARHGRPTAEIRDDLMAEVHQFSGSSHLQDDIALMIIARK